MIRITRDIITKDSDMASNNMYRVGDYVYFETAASSPYQIRRIEELNKTPTGAVEAKVIAFYRRRDISTTLLQLADKHKSIFCGVEYLDGHEEDEEENDPPDGDKPKIEASENALTEGQRHQLKHRELFFSRQLETLPATHIRGKCSVTLLNETESPESYLDREDTFFYQLVYDPNQKTLLADRGEIRIGSSWQAKIPPRLAADASDGRDLSDLETLVWSPSRCQLTVDKVSEFWLLARSVGTLARAYDATAAVRQPSLLASAAAASRDITQQRSYDLLHSAGYDSSAGLSALLPDGQPLLCRDELEEWSPSEGNLFEEAMDKYGKDFHDVRADFLPWKSAKSLVEFYYMWKTTDRYVQQKRIKAVEVEHKLKQVYIPNYTKPNPAVLYTKSDPNGRRSCESCLATSSPQWYAWGTGNLVCRLCTNCWNYWKKYGGLKSPSNMERIAAMNASTLNNGSIRGPGAGSANIVGCFQCTQVDCDKEFRTAPQLYRHMLQAHGIAPPPGEPGFGTGPRGAMYKPRGTHYLHTPAAMRLARVICSQLLKPSQLARKPGFPAAISNSTLRQEFASHLPSLRNYKSLLEKRLTFRPLEDTVVRLKKTLFGGSADSAMPDFLRRDKPVKFKASSKLAFPSNEASRRQELTDLDAASTNDMRNGAEASHVRLSNSQPSIMRKRSYDMLNGAEMAHPSKRPHMTPGGTSVIRHAPPVSNGDANGKTSQGQDGKTMKRSGLS